MEAYPQSYVAHNIPYVVLSGLRSNSDAKFSKPAKQLIDREGINIDSNWPLVENERAADLLGEIMGWHNDADAYDYYVRNEDEILPRFHFKVAGRKYDFPLHKAQPPSNYLLLNDQLSESVSDSSSLILHSPLSPLTPSSPLFPDGLMTPFWITKHQYDLPSVFVSFFDLHSDPARDTFHDNQLKSEINGIKATLAQLGYRIRFVVVLLSGKPVPEVPGIEDRLLNIKRGTGLDLKRSLFILTPDIHPEDLSAFTRNVINAIYSFSMDHYRDSTKHARKKKSKGSVPAPTIPPTLGTSQSLSSQGWGARYEFKMGAFAEFRQELGIAGRHYSSVLETMTSKDGVFETTANWSPRWNEARLLADITAIRLLRALLRNLSTTAAVQVWSGYRGRMKEIIDQRGKGSNNYSWQCWESIMAKSMSELIAAANIPAFSPINNLYRGVEIAAGLEIFCTPESSYASTERLKPWQLLHHPGYWLAKAAMHNNKRSKLADNIPDEDRAPPDMSPASQVAHRKQIYELYLCPEPSQEKPLSGLEGGYDHCEETVDLLRKAFASFELRYQHRMMAKLKLQIGSEYMQRKRYAEAVNTLEPLWRSMSWRMEGWNSLAYEVTAKLYTCAIKSQNRALVVATAWELSNKALNNKEKNLVDFMGCLDSLPRPEDAVKVDLQGHESIPLLFASFHCLSSEGYVGEPLKLQLWLTSEAHKSTSAICISSVMVNLSDSLGTISLLNCSGGMVTSDENTDQPLHVYLNHDDASDCLDGSLRLVGETNLNILPQQRKIYEFSLVPRQPIAITALYSILTINNPRFSFSYTIDFLLSEDVQSIWLENLGRSKRSSKKQVYAMATILPKPPRVDLTLRNQDESYYLNEYITFDMKIYNEEEEEVQVALELHITKGGDVEETVDYSWLDKSAQVVKHKAEDVNIGQSCHFVGTMASATTVLQRFSITAPSNPSTLTLKANALYHLKSDKQTTISKSITFHINILEPLSIEFQFKPCIHPDPWPNYFSYDASADESKDEPGSPDSVDQKPLGLAQRWQMSAKFTSLVHEPIRFDVVEASVYEINGGIVCNIRRESHSSRSMLRPGMSTEEYFVLDIRKVNIEDRGASTIDLNLLVQWTRSDRSEGKENDGNLIATTIEVPRFPVPSSEPRVLAAARCVGSTFSSILFMLEYTLENPTMHFLTFDLAMEASEEFAFSGPKFGSMNILPISRKTIQFTVMPLSQHNESIRPHLRIADRYFNKTLKILATEGLIVDKRGMLLDLKKASEKDIIPK